MNNSTTLPVCPQCRSNVYLNIERIEHMVGETDSFVGYNGLVYCPEGTCSITGIRRFNFKTRQSCLNAMRKAWRTFALDYGRGRKGALKKDWGSSVIRKRTRPTTQKGE